VVAVPRPPLVRKSGGDAEFLFVDVEKRLGAYAALA